MQNFVMIIQGLPWSCMYDQWKIIQEQQIAKIVLESWQLFNKIMAKNINAKI